MRKIFVLTFLVLTVICSFRSYESEAAERTRIFLMSAFSYYGTPDDQMSVVGRKDISDTAKSILDSANIVEAIYFDNKSLTAFGKKYFNETYYSLSPSEGARYYHANAMEYLKCTQSISIAVSLSKTSNGGIEATAFINLIGKDSLQIIDQIVAQTSVSDNQDEERARDEVTRAALNVVADKYISRFGGIPAGVESVDGETVKLSRGKTYGIQKGDFYRIYAESELQVDMFSGDSSQTRADLAIIKITDADDLTSTGMMIADGGYVGTIQPGDRFEKIAEADAKKYTRNILMGLQEDFPKVRPAALQADSHQGDIIADVFAGEANIDIKANAETASSGGIVPSIPDNMPRLGVMSFTSATDEVTKNEAEAITDILTRMLVSSKKIAILERDRLESIAQEHKLNLGGVVDPETAVQLGKLAGCKYMLLGSVTNIEGASSSVGDVSFRKMADADSMARAINTGGTIGKVATALAILDVILTVSENTKEKERIDTQSAAATIDARIVDVETGNIVATMSGRGSASQSTVLQYGSDTEVTVNEIGGLRSQAITAASSHIGLAVREKLGGELMKAVVVEDGSITINQGSMSGIQRGDICVVYPADDPLPGKKVTAIVIVNDVEANFSVAGLYGTSSDIRSIKRGDVLRPVTQEAIDAGEFIVSDSRTKMIAALSGSVDSTKHVVPTAPIETTGNSTSIAPQTAATVSFENDSTDPAKVVPSYGLPSNKTNMLRIAHINIRKIKDKSQALAKYNELIAEYPGDYLAAYHAAEISLAMKDSEGARKWIERTLSINPQYRPAQTLKAKIQ